MPAQINSAAIHAIFGLPAPDDAFDGAITQQLRAAGGQPALLLAFAPGAAGTYFAQAAVDTLRAASPGAPSRPAVFHLPMQAGAVNRDFIEAFRLRPVIMLRNLSDLLAAFWDMLESDPLAGSQSLDGAVLRAFPAMNRREKARFLIETAVPWYARYFATWKRFHEEAPSEVCVLRYRDFCNYPSESLHAALEHAGFRVSVGECEDASRRLWPERGTHRFNQGRPGRGREYFLDTDLKEISRQLLQYPELMSWWHELTGEEDNLRQMPGMSVRAAGMGL